MDLTPLIHLKKMDLTPLIHPRNRILPMRMAILQGVPYTPLLGRHARGGHAGEVYRFEASSMVLPAPSAKSLDHEEVSHPPIDALKA